MGKLGLRLLLAVATLGSFAVSADYGKVRLPGEATIHHDGDYIDYSLRFEANCYAEEQDSIRDVVNAVAGFVSWLDNRALSFSDGSIDKQVNLSSTVKDINPYLDHYYGIPDENRIANPCFQKYSTSQYVSVRVNRASHLPAITNSMVQSVYDEIYQYLWPLNRLFDAPANVYISAKVIDVRKGVHDETLEVMKERAYAHAARVATRRFLAVLGENFGGRWFFHGADFTHERHTSMRHFDIEADAAIAPMPGTVLPPAFEVAPPAIIKLEPLSYYADGVFEFGFTRDYQEINP